MIATSALPTYLFAWVEDDNLCIFVESLFKIWDLAILQYRPWFIDCPMNFYLAEDKT